MKEKYLYLVCSLGVIIVLAIAGCVAPPTETPTGPVDLYDPNQFATNNGSSSGSSFVSEVTLSDYAASTTTPQPQGYTTFLSTTRIPSDITCRIHQKSMFGYNASAFVFNLRNPPMYINYTVVPTNVTVNKVFTDTNTKETKTWTYSDYSPQSWFEITVRSNATKEIYLQDGFGTRKGYSTYLSRTLKILKQDDLLVEFRGNDIRASVSVWVKPLGNFEESRLSEFTECAYMDERRDTIATPVPTTIEGAIYTWEPENRENR
jgi:hypothetical protein